MPLKMAWDLARIKVNLNIQRYGNITAATIPFCLWDYNHEINKRDLIELAALGEGLVRRDVDNFPHTVRFLFFKSLQNPTNDFNFKFNPNL